ncbi:MAG: adenine phosphoribosyltransferase [Verrucomicrobia bacterium]|nr:adenine phosphoribosyltransferase [Verrucomicrobiota bacterium]
MTQATVTASELEQAIRNIPDFPKPGVQFKDITPLLSDPRLLSGAVDLMVSAFKPGDVDVVVGIDARGFIFAGAAAIKLQAGFVPVRKKGKLPFKTHEQSYSLEYGSNTIAIHQDAIREGSRILLVDDLLATGGTAEAAVQLLERIGGRILQASFLIELSFLRGRDRLARFPIRSQITY